jgi:hypothetical protein
MKYIDSMIPYFQGEKLEALVFILPLGLLCMIFGGWLLSEGQQGFAKGIALPFLVLGLLLTVVGSTVGLRTPSQVVALQANYQVAPDATLQAEKDRMTKVNNAWPLYLSVWIAFGAIGLVLRLFNQSELLQGVAVALVFFAGVGLLIDGFADRRAQVYTQAIQEALMTKPSSKVTFK